MCVNAKEFSDPPIVIKVRVRRGMVHEVNVIDVHRDPSWLLEEMRDVFRNILGVEKTSSFRENTSDKAVRCKQVCVHLLTVIAVLEFSSVNLKVLGGNSGPNRNVRGLVRV